LALPLAAVGAIASGLLDAKVKLKRLDAPALIRKMAAGSALVSFSAVGALVVALQGFRPRVQTYALALSLGFFICAVLLGSMGKKPIPAILPD
jgi:MFS-type transporter involved in bile tolerance (Atg22 family)